MKKNVTKYAKKAVKFYLNNMAYTYKAYYEMGINPTIVG